MDGVIATHVITGFLGSGKTTLLNRLLALPAFRDTAVIVNEFGAIGLDHLLIDSASDNIVLLDNGCLCCAATDSLRETLADLYRRRAGGQVPRFRRVVIETSGLADPGPILQTLFRDPLLMGRFAAHPLVCIVDAANWRDTLDEPEACAQIAFAERIVVSKTDLTGGLPPALSARLADLAPGAEMLLADAVRARPELLLDEESHGRWRAPLGHRHDHASDIASLSLRLPAMVDWAGISAWTEHLRQRWGTSLLRTKALLALRPDGAPIVIQGVRATFDISRLPEWPDDDPAGRVVLIGRGLDDELVRRGLRWLDLPEGMSVASDGGFPD